MNSRMRVEERVMEASPIANRLCWTVVRGGGFFREGIVMNFDFLGVGVGVNDLRALPLVKFR